jgi:hypothetical protein
MQTLLGSVFGLFGTGQLQSVALIGLLALGIFRPERVSSWALFRVSFLLLVIAVSLPGLTLMFAGGLKDDFDSTMTMVVSGGGLLTAASIGCLLGCLSRTIAEKPA